MHVKEHLFGLLYDYKISSTYYKLSYVSILLFIKYRRGLVYIDIKIVTYLS